MDCQWVELLRAWGFGIALVAIILATGIANRLGRR